MVDSWIKKTGTVAVEQGDMMRYTASGKITPVSASGDSDELVGIAMSASPATDATATALRVAEIGHGTVFEFDIASSTFLYGDPMLIASAQGLSKKTVTDLFSTATNVVGVVVEDKASTTTVLVRFKPGLFQNQIVTS